MVMGDTSTSTSGRSAAGASVGSYPASRWSPPVAEPGDHLLLVTIDPSSQGGEQKPQR